MLYYFLFFDFLLINCEERSIKFIVWVVKGKFKYVFDIIYIENERILMNIDFFK